MHECVHIPHHIGGRQKTVFWSRHTRFTLGSKSSGLATSALTLQDILLPQTPLTASFLFFFNRKVQKPALDQAFRNLSCLSFLYIIMLSQLDNFGQTFHSW